MSALMAPVLPCTRSRIWRDQAPISVERAAQHRPAARAGVRVASSWGAWRPGGARLLPAPGGAFSQPYLTHAVCFKPLRLFLNLKI